MAERKHRGSVLPGSAQLPARFPAGALVRVLQQFMLSLPRHRLPGFDFLHLHYQLASLLSELAVSVQVAEQRASGTAETSQWFRDCERSLWVRLWIHLPLMLQETGLRKGHRLKSAGLLDKPLVVKKNKLEVTDCWLNCFHVHISHILSDELSPNLFPPVYGLALWARYCSHWHKCNSSYLM